MNMLSGGFAWLDTGTYDSLTNATEFVKVIEKRTSQKTGCLEEIALKYKWIESVDLKKKIRDLNGNYYDYIKKIIN